MTDELERLTAAEFDTLAAHELTIERGSAVETSNGGDTMHALDIERVVLVRLVPDGKYEIFFEYLGTGIWHLAHEKMGTLQHCQELPPERVFEDVHAFDAWVRDGAPQ